MVAGPSPITILMVEDSEEDIKLTLRGLERAKLQNRIWTVRDGVEALAFLQREAPYEAAPRPDLLLLDLNLPKLDGRDVLRRIREDPHLRDIPVVVLTASESEQERFAVHAADAFITKPVNFEQLAKLVQTITDLGWSIVKMSRASAEP
jgi:two-component system, chemotaxis family, response regulator Rcp1